MRAQKYKTEAETFGWSFVFEDFVSEELKSKVTQRIEVLEHQLTMNQSITGQRKCEDVRITFKKTAGR